MDLHLIGWGNGNALSSQYLKFNQGHTLAILALCLELNHQAFPRQSTMRVLDLSVKSGDCIKLKGKIHQGAKSFAINLGRDDSNLAIHLNARFEAHGDVKKIVCNSKSNGQWGAEVRSSIFPFQEGAEIKICLCYQADDIKVKLDGQEISFPNRLGLNTAQYFSVDGDMSLLSFKC
ncbi:16 kDa beta-galactoside-binding lectin-like [Crotalus adamanteus]|uniref:Galectin n=2 Tax=Crotalus TaxID=8728 RepID=A0AAW1BUG0_CROAD